MDNTDLNSFGIYELRNEYDKLLESYKGLFQITKAQREELQQLRQATRYKMPMLCMINPHLGFGMQHSLLWGMLASCGGMVSKDLFVRVFKDMFPTRIYDVNDDSQFIRNGGFAWFSCEHRSDLYKELKFRNKRTGGGWMYYFTDTDAAIKAAKPHLVSIAVPRYDPLYQEALELVNPDIIKLAIRNGEKNVAISHPRNANRKSKPDNTEGRTRPELL